MTDKLNIDSEFESVIPPLTDDEFKQLEENIVTEGKVLNAIITWNGTIVDGHNRYRILQKHPEIEFTVYAKDFIDRFDAISWICKNQLGRRNITPEQKKFLIGSRYVAICETAGGDRKSDEAKSSDKKCPMISSDHATRAKLAEENNVSPGYVRTAVTYAAGVNAAEEALPGIRNQILSGKLDVTDKDISAIAKAPVQERRQMAEDLQLTKEQRQAKVKVLQDIRAISADMAMPKPAVTEAKIIISMQAAIQTLMDTCDNYFLHFPKLLQDETYKAQVIEALKVLIDYYAKIQNGE